MTTDKDARSFPPFAPSDVLVDMVRQSLVEHAIKLGRQASDIASDPALDAGSEKTRAFIGETVAAFARRMASGDSSDITLISYERFEDDFANDLFVGLSLTYDVSPSFFEQLRHEMVIFLAGGGRIDGDWGRLRLDGGAVFVELAAARSE